MKTFTLLQLAAAGGVALGLGSGAALAAGEAGGPTTFTGASVATATCPGIRWAVKHAAPDIAAYFWFTDLSGVSKATGTAAADGSFHLTLTSLDGTGPTGTIDGKKNLNTGAITAKLVGPGCSNLSVAPTKPNYFAGPGGGGGGGAHR